MTLVVVKALARINYMDVEAEYEQGTIRIHSVGGIHSVEINGLDVSDQITGVAMEMYLLNPPVMVFTLRNGLDTLTVGDIDEV